MSRLEEVGNRNYRDSLRRKTQAKLDIKRNGYQQVIEEHTQKLTAKADKT